LPPASADISALQTAASIENLAVATYRAALARPDIAGPRANPVIERFLTATMAHHAEHARMFNATVVSLGGREQHGDDPRYAPGVRARLTKISGPGDAVALASTLEDIAAQTYILNTTRVTTAELRRVFITVGAVEAAHRAVLRTVAAVLDAHDADAVAVPPAVARLPRAAGSAGFPDGFHPTSMASPVTEGAVR
jgi:Ferritin-like domain